MTFVWPHEPWLSKIQLSKQKQKQKTKQKNKKQKRKNKQKTNKQTKKKKKKSSALCQAFSVKPQQKLYQKATLNAYNFKT